MSPGLVSLSNEFKLLSDFAERTERCTGEYTDKCKDCLDDRRDDVLEDSGGAIIVIDSNSNSSVLILFALSILGL